MTTPQEKQTTVQTLYQQGCSKREIARLLTIDIKTVRTIIASTSTVDHKQRGDKIDIDTVELKQLYHMCQGYVERMYEKLTEEQGVVIGYSTLTRLLREKGIGSGDCGKKRSEHVEDVPGEEMQHDTTVYTQVIGGIRQKIICSGIYLRYSKMRYVRFYKNFDRFTMKCFIDEALRHWGYCARVCIIDNTNLAVHYGTGSSAVMHQEMVAFADNYGFIWNAHALNHPNRKAGTERNFYTVQTNFLPGRTFSSLENLNEQAYHWATKRFALRPQAKTKLIPAQAFEYEKPSLRLLPPYIAQPYVPLKRRVDEYGYVVVDTNYFWIPEKVQVKTSLSILRYQTEIVIYESNKELVRYKLPPANVRNEKIVPQGIKTKPRGEPNDRKPGHDQEEKCLREMGTVVQEYIDFIKTKKSGVKRIPGFIRGLYRLSKDLTPALFIQTVQRAHQYQVNDLQTLHRIASGILQPLLPDYRNSTYQVSEDYQNRPSYRSGRFTEENDLDYDAL
jgi:transposase